MLEEDCQVCEADVLNQCTDECNCLASERLTDVLSIARKQHDCLKRLYNEYLNLKAYVAEIKTSDNGNIHDEDEATRPKSYRRRSTGDVPSFMSQFNVETRDSGKQLSNFDKPVAESKLDTVNLLKEENVRTLVDSQEKRSNEATHIASYLKHENGEEKKTISDLPMEIKHLIFKYLKFEDIFNLHNASAAWNEAARDVLVWKSAPLDLDIESDLDKLPNIPYLHTINGDIADGDILFDHLANNVLDLRKMNCDFVKPISLEKFQNFLYSFEKLESIYLRSSDPNFLELLEAVSIHPNIISLYLKINSKTECTEVVKNICRILHSGFLALRKLDVGNNLDFDNALEEELSELCKVKLSQLTDFSFVTDYDYVSKAFNCIFKSAQLESLYIFIDNPYAKSVDLDISSMTALKRLTLGVSKICYKTLMFSQNIEYLQLHSIRTRKIIGKAVDSLPPSLRVLDINYYCDPDLDRQLDNIDRLSSLHTVIIGDCKGFSVVGVETILMKCAGLRRFEVISPSKAISFRDKTYQCLKNCKYLGDFEFIHFVLNPYKFVIAISVMKYLTNVHIYCTCRNEDGSEEQVTEEMINKIIKECKFEKPYAKIHC